MVGFSLETFITSKVCAAHPPIPLWALFYRAMRFEGFVCFRPLSHTCFRGSVHLTSVPGFTAFSPVPSWSLWPPREDAVAMSAHASSGWLRETL